MKRFLVLLVCMGVMVLAGCGGKEEPAETKKPVTMEGVKKETGEATQTAEAYTRQQMDEYRQRVQAKLEDFDKKLDEMRAKTEKMKKEARAEMEQQMTELRKKREEAAKELEKMQSESGKAWEDIKTGLDSALDEMDKAYQQAASRFK